jgi:hypothetical protein
MNDQWHYSADQQARGPIPWRRLRELAETGQLRRDALVWRPGMEQWARAATVEGLFTAPPPLPPPPAEAAAAPATPVAYAHPGSGRMTLQQRRERSARINCVTLAVLAGVCGLAVFASLYGTATRAMSWLASAPAIMAGFLLTTGIVFAAIYLPIARKTIGRIESGYRWAGWIGAAALVIEAAAMALAIAVQ